MSGADDYCSGFDANGNPVYRWQTTPDAPELHRIYDVLDFAEARRIPVYLGEWSPPGRLGIHSPGDPRWAQIIAAFVAHLRHDRHYTVVRHYILMNEPNGDWMWRGSSPDYAAWSTGVRNLRSAFDKAGLQEIILTGPDNSGGQAWFDRAVADLHTVFDAWEQHIYATDAEVTSGGLEQRLLHDGSTIARLDPDAAHKPKFIAESGLVTGKIEALDQQPRVHDFDYGVLMADYIVQIARAGWGGADAWDLDDAMHGNGHDGKKIWGFFDSSSDTGMQPRPWYWVWSVLSNSMPGGAEILQLPVTGDPDLRATEVRWGNDWSVVLVNQRSASANLTVALPGGGEFREFRYFEGDRKTDTTGAPQGTSRTASTSPVQITFPSRGVVVLTTASF